METVLQLVTDLFAAVAPYAGFAALATLVVQSLKTSGTIQDGDAGKVSALINLVGGAAIYIIKQTIVGFDFATADALLGEVASVAVAVIALFGQMGGSKSFYLLAKWVGAFKSASEPTE